jgi:spore coat protein A
MGRTSRREVLRLGLTAAPALALPETIRALATPVVRKPGQIERYLDPLLIPQRINPTGKRDGVLEYRLPMEEFEKQLHSQLPATKLWGYDAQYPGPVFDVMRGQQVEVRWENKLPAKHLFAIDPHLHGAMPPSPAVRTVPHLHGSRTPSESDGLPEDWFTPGQSALYLYPNDQRAACLWYHDHAVGITRLNTYAGLAGFYLLRDEQELSMKLPSGAYEIPLLLQDRTLDEAGQLVYAPTHEDGERLPPGVWGPEFFGELPVINGVISPHLEVEPAMYRLRVINGANSRFFQLYLNLAKSATDVPNLVSFQQIGSDGGLLAGPVKLDKVLLGPGERADLLVDFSGLDGKTLTLSNSAAVPFPGWGMLRAMRAPLSELMQFRVTLARRATNSAFSLPRAISLPRLRPEQAVRTRDFALIERLDAQGRSLGVRIDDKGYDDPVTELPVLGSLERWRFINTTDDAHPMHLHLVQFQVLERQGYDVPAFLKGSLRLVGEARPPAAQEAGWKDTAVVTPREVLSILVPFVGFAGKYVFHCHMLEHEDNDMMRPFVVVAKAGDQAGAKNG